MPDEPNPLPSPTETLGNDPSARNPDGSIKDTQSTLKPAESTAESPNSKPSTETKPEAPAGAPEKYADFKAPEGFELDSKTLEAATPIFKELGLSQDAAQRLVDFYAAQTKQAADAPMEAYRAVRAEWRASIAKSDLGNGSDNLKPEVAASVSAAINAMPNAAKFREALDISGMGDNPEFIRGFYELAKRAGEGTSVRGGGPSPLGQRAPNSGPRSAASALYPNLPSAS